MKKINIFTKEVSYFRNKTHTSQGEKVLISKLLTSVKHKATIEELRRTNNEQIKDNLPCYTPSGIFSVRNDEHLIEHSGFVCIDIDKKDNENVGKFAELKKLIVQIPYVAYCGLSCRGQGYFVLIPIEYPEKHREHYVAICDDFERCNITVDRTSINLSRIRFVSYDDQAYFNDQAVVYTRMVEMKPDLHAEKNKTSSGSTHNNDFGLKCSTHSGQSVPHTHDLEQTNAKVAKIIQEISNRRIDITDGYKNWLAIGAAIANQFGDSGRNYYHTVSQFYKDYDVQKTDDQYSACLSMSKITIGTLFHYAKLNGICV